MIIFKELNMKNIKCLGLIVSVICCMLPVSCSLIDFSEDCIYYGDVEIRADWSALTKGETKPVLTDIYLLSSQSNYMYRVTSDTLVTGVQATNYNVLALNSYGLENISFSGMDCPNTAEAELRTYENAGRLYTVTAPAFYTANTDLTVIPFEKTVSKSILKSAIRQINIDFTVVDNTDIRVSSINGELSGIAYKYGFKGLDALESAAWLPFDTEINTGKSDLFSSNMKVFGINPDKQSTGSIENLLDITLQTKEGKIYKETIDLTSVFNGFITQIIHITIEIRFGLMGMEAGITGWDVSDGGIIEL